MRARTAARDNFDVNWKIVKELNDLNASSHEQTAARNRAALVFCITAWETYVEDAVCEIASILATDLPSFQALPKKVQQTLVNKVTPEKGIGSKSPSGKYPADLADDNWRELLRELSFQATYRGNFNTPSSKAVKDLVSAWCGIDVTQRWAWRNTSSNDAAKRLDESISLRCDIVHTGVKPEGLNKNWIETYGMKNIGTLVRLTDEVLLEHVEVLCNQAKSNQQNSETD